MPTTKVGERAKSCAECDSYQPAHFCPNYDFQNLPDFFKGCRYFKPRPSSEGGEKSK